MNDKLLKNVKSELEKRLIENAIKALDALIEAGCITGNARSFTPEQNKSMATKHLTETRLLIKANQVGCIERG